MFIPEFVCGVLAVLIVEIVALVIAAVVHMRKK